MVSIVFRRLCVSKVLLRVPRAAVMLTEPGLLASLLTFLHPRHFCMWVA